MSQLNRETNENEPPQLSNLRDTGAAEEHATAVLFLWTKPADRDQEFEPTQVIVAKQRNGPAGIAESFEFAKSWGGFSAR